MSKAPKQNKLGTKSVPNSSAQNNHLCATGTGLELSRITRIPLKVSDKFVPSYIDIIINLQANYGLRISEVLAIKGTDISPQGAVMIKGLKKSSNRIIIPTEYKEWWLKQRSVVCSVFDGISRFVVYREYKKRNICISVEGNTKKAVTHAFRHLVINDLRNITKNEEEISNFSGHKATKNTSVYGKIGN